MTKTLIFDSSTIITLALNDLLYILEPLKNEFEGEFCITPQVKQELVDRPLQLKKYMLEALMIKSLIDKDILKVADNPELNRETEKILALSNRTFKTDHEFMKIIHRGEASCLALYKLTEGDKAVALDERTTRMLVENPDNLKKLFEKKFHRTLRVEKQNYSYFEGIRIIRSCELAYIAFEKKIINFNVSAKDTMGALLYAVKFKGCAISWKEIDEIKRIV
jgi:predicted nucleic acid-binding protein